MNNIQNSNIFSLFPEYKIGQYNINDKKEVSNTNLLELQIQADTFEQQEEAAKSKKRKKILFGSTIASGIFSAGVVGLFLLKGFHGGSFSKISRYAQKLAAETHKMKASDAKDFVTKTTYWTRKGVAKSVDTLQATSNFTALKDFISDKILRSNKVTAKFADTSQTGFRKVLDKTLGKKFDKVGVEIKHLTSLIKNYDVKNLTDAQRLEKINVKGQIKTAEEWLNILSEQSKRLESEFDKGFSLGARRMRDSKRSSLLSDLPQKIQERFFKNGKLTLDLSKYKTYATEDLSQKAKQELQDDILRSKKQITNNIDSIYDDLINSFNSFRKAVNPQDETATGTMKKLKTALDNFRKCSGSNEAKSREKISKEISNIIDDLVQSSKSSNIYTLEQKKELIKVLTSIKETAINTGESSKGSLEEIMTILNGLHKAKGENLVSKSQLKEFSKISSKISKGLNAATDLEINDYFLKRGEMIIGSAATDVISVLFPLGVGAYSIAASEGKDEKISTALTTCIPLVGTFATMVYGTTKMFSGVKNLMFAGISGLALKFIGDGCDKLYKKYKSSGSVATVVKDEYDKLLTGFEEKDVKKK